MTDRYFHGDTGAGLGASHQTGWTGLVAPSINLVGDLGAAKLLGGSTLADGLRAAIASPS